MTRSRPVTLAIAVVASAAATTAAPRQSKPLAPPQTMRDGRTVPAPAGTGSIVGTVVAADAGRAVRRVHVVLSSTASSSTPGVTLSVTTADDGQFTFSKLPAGEFTLTASRPGFLDSTFGQKQPGSGRPGTPIVLVEGQKLDRVLLPIARGGVITGTVVDDRGEPEFGAQVRALRWVMRTGERSLQLANTTSTDDRGMYRLTGLVPGDYLVSATSTDTPAGDQAIAAKARAEVAAARADLGAIQELSLTISNMVKGLGNGPDDPTGYAPVFYPGTTQPSSATTVTLGVAEERQAVDLALQLVPLVRVTGIVSGAAGQGGSMPVTLTPLGSSVPLPGPRTMRLAADGTFTFTGVAPGSYNVMAQTVNTIVVMKIGGDQMMPMIAGKPAGAPEMPILWASTDVVVDGHPMAPLALALQPGLTMTGRIAASGSGTPPDFTRARLTVSAVSSASPERNAQVPPATIDASGRFTMNGLVPGRYRLNLSGIGSWTVGSAVVGGRDVMDVPLDVRSADDLAGMVITLTDRSTTVTGRLQDTGGRPTSDFTVVVFPSDSSLWLPQARRIQATRPGTDGRYAFHQLPPGDYRVALVPDVEPGQWYDPAWLRSIAPQALAITLTEGQQLTQDLRVR